MSGLRNTWLMLGLCVGFSGPVWAQPEQSQTIDGNAAVIDKTLIDDIDLKNKDFTPEQAPLKPLHAKFQELLTGAKLTGHFTIDGKSIDDLREESYEIEKVEKAQGDQWVITARIKYGKHDLKVPVPVNIMWAGTTPVLVLDDITIPGLGTFGARVVFHKDKYAGTWRHDDVGGHMFGKIELAKQTQDGKSEIQDTEAQ